MTVSTRTEPLTSLTGPKLYGAAGLGLLLPCALGVAGMIAQLEGSASTVAAITACLFAAGTAVQRHWLSVTAISLGLMLSVMVTVVVSNAPVPPLETLIGAALITSGALALRSWPQYLPTALNITGLLLSAFGGPEEGSGHLIGVGAATLLCGSLLSQVWPDTKVMFYQQRQAGSLLAVIAGPATVSAAMNEISLLSVLVGALLTPVMLLAARKAASTVH